ncbi:winged helix-turn-helix transcriptional regulator [Rhodococcus sp. 077-4]|uniref:winged helix-turn-helix transcriptional regulator n=1 Tax=Rhodococcus sp. 077-4 TaxID=2789271 RepID=UPI0039F64368
MTTGPRSYGQACPLALSMDLLGERWTMLVVRELLMGPKRFGDLDRRLDGVGPNRLTKRLRLLQSHGVVDKIETGAYGLTPEGEGLREPVTALAIWGLRLMTAEDLALARPDMVAMCVASVVDPLSLSGHHATCEFDVGDVFTIVVAGGRMTTASGPAKTAPNARVTCAPTTFLAITAGYRDLDEALRSGDAHVDGSVEAGTAVFSMFTETYRANIHPAPMSAG